uniref:Beta-microseminoprotein-like n=2 Tax=Gasterosteus aculeatus TaxID=69293 RepID=A0AAQ4PII4_GASAC|nr:beta-microseminoprotein-like [Gasterosteus aculeatus aculeatus]
MKSLALALLLCALASPSEAHCFINNVKEGTTHCQDYADNTWHAVGSSWRNSECMDCTCGQCCSGYTTPRVFPDNCVSVFDPQACQYVVHVKGDPTTLCPIFAAVGK